MSIYNKLENPPKKYRAIPFWSWNDKLNSEELKRQIKEMEHAGIGGYFMHARGGLETPYLQDEWMACVKTCIDEGNALGMDSWCYDENGWPSGFADGKIPNLGIEYQKKWLIFEPVDPDTWEWTDRSIALYRKDGNSYSRITKPVPDCEMAHAYYGVDPYYIDTLDAKVVRAFLESTYERYFEEFKEQFGQGMKGIFTDEPHFGRPWIPWSYVLEEAFLRKNGYNLLDAIPALYNETAGFEKVRYDFWKTVTELFVDAYARQLGQWCEEHDCQFTGHIMAENTLLTQLMHVGDAMAFYEYMHLPGIDWLGRNIGSDPIVPKQVSSVAHQLGKKQVISEMFGCAGWNISFEELKRIAEWQFVHGVNLICQHLQGYSLRGLRKRDYPPSLYYHQPWWKEYRSFNDYFARLGMLLSEGTHVADILLLHPIRTGWIVYDSVHHDEIKAYNNSFAELSEMLSRIHYSHDYGCETLLEKHGKVTDGRLHVGQAVYRTVVIPPSLVLSSATLELIEQLVEQGGTVIACEPFPVLVDGVRSERLAQLKKRLYVTDNHKGSVKELLLEHMPSEIEILHCNEDAETIVYQQNQLEGHSLFYLVNMDREKQIAADIRIKRNGAVEQIDLETGQITRLAASRDGGTTSFSLSFKPSQSYMIKITETEEDPANPEPKEAGIISDDYVLSECWNIKEADLNVITLDMCRLRIKDGQWMEKQPVILWQERLLEMTGSFEIELEFRLNVNFDIEPTKECFLVMEEPEQFEIRINGQTVPGREIGWWRDISFKKVNIAGMLSRGENTIRLKRMFYNSEEKLAHIERAKTNATERNRLTYDCEIESIYILGDFGVACDRTFTEGERKALFQEGSFTLVEPRASVSVGDLTAQGFPFFAGRMRLGQTIRLTNVERFCGAVYSFLPPDAVVSKLWVNGQQIKTFMWEPYEADICSYLQEGENEIEIELFSSLRNLLGPHHHVGGELYFVGTSSFKDKPGWTDAHLGLDHIYTDRYCFVKFGLTGSPAIRFIQKQEVDAK